LGTFVPAPPVWVRQPEPNVIAYVGSTPSFVVQASGLGSLAPKYYWSRNGTPIANGTNKVYTLPSVVLGDSGASFTCKASNAFGQIFSSAGTLTVIAAPTQSYPVAVLGNNPLGYWRLNESPDDAAGNNGVITHDYRGGHNGYYSNTVIAVSGYNPASDTDTAAKFGDPLASANSYVAEINDVDFARPINTGGASFSIEAWAYGGNQSFDSAIVTKGYNGILLAGTGTGTEQFVLDVSGGNPRKFRFPRSRRGR